MDSSWWGRIPILSSRYCVLISGKIGNLSHGLAEGITVVAASVIVPCLNQLEFTRHCLRALFRHTRPPWELIVIDNGSTDGTGDVPGGRAGRRPVPVTVIANARNRGFPAAVNQGLSVAKGEYLVLLNNDAVVTDSLAGSAHRAGGDKDGFNYRDHRSTEGKDEARNHESGECHEWDDEDRSGRADVQLRLAAAACRERSVQGAGGDARRSRGGGATSIAGSGSRRPSSRVSAC